jgi:hypothetical protein
MRGGLTYIYVVRFFVAWFFLFSTINFVYIETNSPMCGFPLQSPSCMGWGKFGLFRGQQDTQAEDYWTQDSLLCPKHNWWYVWHLVCSSFTPFGLCAIFVMLILCICEMPFFLLSHLLVILSGLLNFQWNPMVLCYFLAILLRSLSSIKV